MKTSKGIMEEHQLVIYPIHFTAVIGDMEKEVNGEYEPYDGIHNYIGMPQPPTLASTYNVRHKDSKETSLMVWIPTVEDCTSEVVTHECTHAALEIFKKIGSKVDVDNQETFCYLTGTLARLFIGTLYNFTEVESLVKPKHSAKITKSKKK